MTRLMLALTVLALLAAGCAARPAAMPAASWDRAEMAVEAPMAEEMGDYDGIAVKEAEVAGSDSALPSTAQQMIIRTASLSVIVQETQEAVDSISDLLASHQGYVAQSRTWRSGDDVYASMTLRVPAASLDTFLEELRGYVVRVEDSTISGQDVTEEYTDLQARLRNLEATEEELRILLTEVRQSRSKAEDILAIHRELTSIRGQIESLQGRKQYLERMTAMATVNLTIRPQATPRPVVQDRWTPLVTLTEAIRALLSVLQVFMDIAIYLLVFSPIFIVPILVLWLIVRLVKRNKARKAS